MPVIIKKKSQPGLVGPDLSELEYSEIHFRNDYEEIQLAGMLFIPEGDEPFPIVVIIHGSGPSSRNNAWYLSVAKYLQENGIAVLLPDKRGSEKSEGEWIGANFEELSTDTLSAIDYLKNQEINEYSAIGLVGMSQGGWIAPIVAEKSDDVAFIVSMSCATVTTDEQLLFEEINNIEPYTYKFIAQLIAPLTTKRLKGMEHISAFMGFDPIPYWKNVGVPVFMAFGGNDKNVPIEASIDRLEEYSLSGFKVKVYAGGGHAIRDIQSNGVSDDFLLDLKTFIEESMQ